MASFLGFNFGSKKQKTIETKVDTKPKFYSQFSSPFGRIGEGNLSLPYVLPRNGSYVPFGGDNVYPQIINQMYYQSPLNAGIINFKTNAVIGGGFNIDSIIKTAAQRVDEYTFIKKNNVNKISRQVTKDLIMHGRVYILVNKTEDGKVSVKRLGPETIRVNQDKSTFYYSSDWTRKVSEKTYVEYNPSIIGESIYVYEIDGDAGQDIYPIPAYCSALNDAFLDGETSYLMKSNIINSIFPSFMITLAKSFGSEAELNQFKQTMESAKGAPNAGRILTFIGDENSPVPTITPIPINQNDKIFDSTLKRVDENICRGHQIDPLLTGIRVAGSLGQGNELEKAYTIFEKTFIHPTRAQVEEILNDIFEIGGIPAKITIKNYQIVDNVIVDQTKDTKI